MCDHDAKATGITHLRAGWTESQVRCEECGEALTIMTLDQHSIQPEWPTTGGPRRGHYDD